MVVVTNNPETEPMISNTPPARNGKKKNPLTAEAYKNITSSMRAEPLQIDSLITAMELLTTAIQLQNMPLVNECIKNLDELLNHENVLTIYTFLSTCKMPIFDQHDFRPTAPPIIENENQRGTDWVEVLINNLRYNCLLVIDKDADYVLQRKEMFDLSYIEIYSILKRDTLEVSSEVFVYICMLNWGLAECSRMTLDISHLPDVLRQLRFTPRYGLMSKKEFSSRLLGNVKGPTKSGVLKEKEWRLYRFYLDQKSKQKSVSELDFNMSTQRYSGNDKPHVLSCKSLSRFENKSVSRRSSLANNKCEKCLINFLSCWTAIFD